MLLNRLDIRRKLSLFSEFSFDYLNSIHLTDSSSTTLESSSLSFSLSTITTSVLPFLRFSSSTRFFMAPISFFKVSSFFFSSYDILAKMRFIPSEMVLVLFSFMERLLSRISSRKFLLSPFLSKETTSLSLTVLFSLSISN
jgi:hypothetical protein